MAGKTGRGVSEDEEMTAIKQLSRVEGILQLIPAEIISRRAVECGSYARALFHWEQYVRQQRDMKAASNQPFKEKDELLQHLQMIYAHIDEPDSIEGISAHLKVLNPEQQSSKTAKLDGGQRLRVGMRLHLLRDRTMSKPRSIFSPA
jgi:serine/threonine-protein kinase ATR